MSASADESELTCPKCGNPLQRGGHLAGQCFVCLLELALDEEEVPKKKPKKPAKEPKAPKKPKARSRTAKVSRMKLVWGVFNNSNVRVAAYDYPKKHEAEEHAARLTTDKKSTHFVQPVKEPIEEKKE